jgi:hypothetical protein
MQAIDATSGRVAQAAACKGWVAVSPETAKAVLAQSLAAVTNNVTPDTGRSIGPSEPSGHDAGSPFVR